MNARIELLNNVSAIWQTSILRACWQGGLALAAVWIISLLFRRLSPATKVWLWRLALAKCLIAFFWTTPIDLPLLKAAILKPSAARDALIVRPQANAASAEWTPAAPTVSRLAISSWLFLLWLTGLAACGVRLGKQFHRSRVLLRTSERCDDPVLNREIARVASSLRVKHPPVILISSLINTPLLTGCFRSWIVLPKSITTDLPVERICMILAHEAAHVARRDLTWIWFFSLAEACFFFHPMIWIARREWRTQQEMACDALAIKAAGTTVRDYADMLLDLVCQNQQMKPALVLNMIETKQTLQRRIMAMKTMRSVSRIRILITGITLALIAALGLVPWRVIAQESASQEEISKLKEENARLKEELQKARRVRDHRDLSETAGLLASRIEQEVAQEIGKSLADAKAKLDQLLANRDKSDPLVLQKKAELQALEKVRGTMPVVEKSVRLALQAAQEELERLQVKFTPQHPLVRQKQAAIDALEKTMTRKPATDNVAGTIELLFKEIELNEQQVAIAKKRFETGTGTQAEVLQATHDLFGARRELARLRGDNAEQKKLFHEEIKAMEQMLETVQLRIRTGNLPSDSRLQIEKELLKLRRELLDVQ